MKLHLPTRLRAAVLACFAVVTSFTTTLATGALAGGAFVVTATALVAPQAEGAAFDSITHGGDFWISDYRYSFILDDVGSNGTVVAAYWGNSATGNNGANGLKVTDNGDGTYSVALDNCKLNNTAIDATTTLTSNRGTTFDGLVLKTGVVYTVTASGIVGGDNGAKATITDVVSGTATESGTYNSNMNGNQNPPYNKVNDAYAVNGSTALVWTGDMAAWKNTSGEVTALSADKVLYFDASESVSKTADVGGDVSVAGMKLYDNYTINATAAANIAAANGVTVVGDKTMTLSADAGNTSTNTVSADFSGGLAVSSGTWALSGAVNARSLAVNGGVLTLSGAVNLSGMNFAAADGDTVGVSAGAALTFADSAAINLGNLAADTAYKIFDLASGASLNGWDALTAENFIVNGAALNSTVYEVTLTNGTFMYSMLVSDLTWNGGDSGVWDFTTACWTTGDSGSVFGNDVNVIFNNTASVEVQGAINAGKMTVTSGNTLTLSASEGNSISVTDLDIQGSLQNSVAIAVSGNVTMADTASWTLTDGAAQVLTEAQFAAVKNMEVQNGASVTLSSITTGQNETVDATQLSGAGNVILKLRGDNGVNFNLANFAGDIRVEKADGQASARLQLNNSVFHADSTIILQTNGDLVFNGTGTEINNDIVAEGTTKFFVNSGKSATINSDLSGAGTITKTAAGTLTLNGTVTVSEFISEGGTTNISGGSITAFKITGGTVNVNGGVVTSLSSRGGTTNLGDASGTHIWVGGGATVNVIGDYTASQLRMSEQNTSTVNIKDGGSLTITGSENGHNTNRSILLAHWGYNSTLHMEGGSLTATDAVLFPSWTGTGTFKATAGTATLKGISFYDQSYSGYSAKGQFLLGDASSGAARVNIGSEGISHVNGTSVVVNLGNGTLGATDDWVMRFESGQTSANVQLVGTAGGTVFDTMGHTVTVNTTLGGDGKLVKEGEGTLDLIGTVTSTGSVIAKGGMLNIKSAGPNSFSTMEVAEGGALTIETDAVANVENLKLVAPLTNKGTLTISGSLTVDLSGFTPETGSGAISYVDSAGNTSDNGYRTGNFTYKLIDNTGTLNDDAITSVVGSDGTYADGILTTTTPDYSNYWVNTTVDAEALPASRKYYINGGTLNVGTDAANILKTAVGSSGILNITANCVTTGDTGLTTQFEGTLALASGVSLTLGKENAGNHGDSQVINTSSLTAVHLYGGSTLNYHGNGVTTLKNLTVKDGTATLHFIDANDDNTVQIAGVTTLTGSLNVTSQYDGAIAFERLTGAGNMTVSNSTGGSEGYVFRVNSLQGYGGKLSLTKSGGSFAATVSTGTESVSFKGIAVDSSVNLGLNVQSAVTMSEGLSLSNGSNATVAIASGASLSGAVNVTGAGNSLTSTVGGMNLSQLNVAEGAALDLNGAVSALLMNQAGTVDIAGMSLTDGAVLTYGNAANLLSVTDGMLAGNVVIGTGLALTDAGVNLGLSSAIAQEKIGISNYANSALLVVGDTWHLKSVAVDPDALRRYYWEGNGQAYDAPQWSLTDDDTSTLVELPADTSNVILVYSNAGEKASPCRMTLDDNMTVAGIEVTGGYYSFTTGGNPLLTCTGNLVLGEGGHLSNSLRMAVGNVTMAANSSLSINSALTIAEGGKVTVTGAGVVINQGRGGQPQSLSTSALEITGDGSSLSIVGLANSKSATTLGSVTLGDNTTLTLKDGATDITATATALSLGTGAAIVLEANQVLDLTAIEDMDDEDTGKFSKLLNATSGAGTLKVSMPGEFRMKTDTAVNTNLEDAQLKINSYGTGGKTLTVMENGSITLTGRLILQSTAKTLVAGGSLTADKIELGHQTAGEPGHGNPGHIEMTGGSITTGGFVHRHAYNTVTIGGGTLDITSTTGISNGIGVTITGGTLVASDAGGWGMTSASVGGAAVSADSAGKVTMTNTTVTGNITGNDKLVLAGTVNATANATVSGASVGGIMVTTTDANKLTLNNTTIGSTITNNGELGFSGTQNVTLAGSSATKYAAVYGSTDYGDNGYKSTVDVYTLVSGTAASAALDTIWQVNGVALSSTPTFDGKVLTHITEDAAGKVYYINSGTVLYETGAGCTAAEKLQLEGGKLVMSKELDTAVTTGGIAVTGSSTTLELKTELAANKLSMGTGAATVLMGDGTLNLGTGTSLASGISLGKETDAKWAGTVKVAGASLTDADLSGLGIAGSTIELNDTDGTLKGGTYNAALKLTNGSEVSLGANNNFASLDATGGSLSIAGIGNSITTLTMADAATLGMNLGSMGLNPLKDLGTDALLTVGTLNAGTPGGALSLQAIVSKDLLLTMSDGQSITLVDITTNNADLGFGLLADSSTPVTEVDVKQGAFTYTYTLESDTSSGHTLLKLSAVLNAVGWVGDTTDTWKTTDTVGGTDSNWEEMVGGFYGFGSGTVNLDAAGVNAAGSDIIVSASQGTKEYTFEGGALSANTLAVSAGSLTVNNSGVSTATAALVSNESSLSINSGKKLTVGTDMAVLNKAEFTNAGTTEVKGTLTVDTTAKVNNSGTLQAGTLNASGSTITNTGTLISGGGSIGTLAGNGSLKNTGTLSIESATVLNALTNSGTLSVNGDLTVNSAVTQGGTVTATNVTVNGTATFASVNTGTLTAEAATLTNADITTLATDKLTVLGSGTVAVADAMSLSSLSGAGTLQTSKLTLSNAVAGKVNVQADEVVLDAIGNSLGAVQTNSLTMGDSLVLSTSEAMVKLSKLTALSGDTVHIVSSDAAFNSLNQAADGVYLVADYIIASGVSGTATYYWENAWQLDAIRATGMNAGLTVNNGTLSLSISEITNAAGEVVGMVWDTTNGNTKTNNGAEIDTDAGFYKALDYVKQVLVTEDVTFDLSADSVGDSVAGNTNEPLAGLLVRNLSGGGKLTIKGNSAEQDVATLMNTPGRAIDAVALTADAATVNLGLPKGTIGYLESDAASVAPTLDALKLVNRSVVNVNSNTEVLGDTDVADYTRLSVKEGNMLTTGMLSGTDEAEISGVIRVTKGGVYTGTYDEASVIAAAGSKLRLRTGGRRGLSILAQNGGSVTLDSAGKDGRMDHFCVGTNPYARMAENGGASLKLLNTSLSDGAIHHSTITLTEDEGNYINESEVSLSLGAAETARTLSTPGSPVVIDGVVDVLNSSITVNMLGNTVKDGVLEVNTASDKDLTLARLVTAGTVEGNTVTLAGTPEVMTLLSKYYTNVRLESNGAIMVDRVTDYYGSRLSVSNNARVGISMADAALVKLNPQANRAEYAELSGVLDALDAAVATGNSQAADELGAAVSGASVAALGAAVAGDVERQLMGIRNRTTTMGVDQTQVNEHMPYFNAWINAEGDFRRMDEDGTAAGYELSSWGGTVGFDVDMTPRLTMGLAATAMYGDFNAKSADHAEGDLDTYYVTAFGRYAANRWSHTFVASVGMADTSLKRTVSHAGGSYSAEGDAEGMSFGFLYELGYVIAMNETATACLQPVFNVMLSHSSLDGYAEEGGDAALKMGGVDMTTVTFGMGARAQAIVGTNLYNRSSMVEGRALLKLRTGDTEAEAENSLCAVPGATGSVQSAEIGTIGVELGVGITIPMGLEGGAVFADASLEIGGGYTNINGTVGYRINF